MGNRIYSINGSSNFVDEPVQNRNIYVDLDSVSIYQESIGKPNQTDSEQYRDELIGFIKYLIINLGNEYTESLQSHTINTANLLSKFPIEDVLRQLSIVFNDQYTYDEIVEYYNSFTAGKKYIMKKLVNANAVKNSLKQIFTWIPGERILNPEFGSKLRLLLYEQITDENHEKIISEVQHCITKWEPRVEISDIRKITTVEDVEENTVNIEIKYHIIGLDEEYSYIYSSRVFNE